MELYQIQSDEVLTEETRSVLTKLLQRADSHYNPIDIEDDIENRELFLLSDDGENVGVAVLRFTDIDGALSGRIDNLSIAPEYQGMGYGSQVVREFSVMCLGRGVRELHTVATSPESRQFFMKQGLSDVRSMGAVGVLMRAKLDIDHSN